MRSCVSRVLRRRRFGSILLSMNNSNYDFTAHAINGRDAHPLYKHLTSALPGKLGQRIKWNFTKFLITPNGSPVKRYAPADRPLKIIPDIKELLEVQ